MDNNKSLDNLLKELNDMQMQFDNLKETLIIDKNKKNKSVKTKLSSDKIDDDFFKTLSNVPTKDIEIKTNNNLIKEDNNDELFFSIDNNNIVKKEKQQTNSLKNETIIKDKKNDKLDVNKIEINIEKESFIEKKDAKSKVEIITEKINIDEEKRKITDVNIDTSKEEINQKSFLSIKDKLEKIKKEIAEKEAKINKENNITKPKVIKSKTKSKKLETKFVKHGTKVININNNNLLSNKVLSPTKKENKATQPIKKEIRKEPKTVNEKPNNDNTIDILTIIILLLIIVLIGTAWFILM